MWAPCCAEWTAAWAKSEWSLYAIDSLKLRPEGADFQMGRPAPQLAPFAKRLSHLGQAFPSGP